MRSVLGFQANPLGYFEVLMLFPASFATPLFVFPIEGERAWSQICSNNLKLWCGFFRRLMSRSDSCSGRGGPGYPPQQVEVEM